MILDEIGTYLQAEDVGILGSTMFLGEEPDAPDSLVSLYEYGGRPPAHIQNINGIAYEYPRVQVMARNPSYQGARTILERAYRALDFGNRMLGNTRYLRAMPLQSPFLVQRDANRRFELAFNVELTKTLSG